MYSPVQKKGMKALDREKIKEAKRAQLCLLLVNKFRNKFGVITTAEHDIDQFIISEVQALLGNQNEATQSGLKTLDLKLTSEIKKMRGNSKPLPTDKDSKIGSVMNMNQIDARSSAARSGDARSSQRRSGTQEQIKKQQMQNSRSSNIMKPTSPGYLLDEPLVYHDDPAAKLCIDENQWNKIVQDNLRKFEEDKVQAKEKKLLKAQTIQKEQLKQVEEKNRRKMAEKMKDQDYFNSVGKNASNVYYVNHDKQVKQKTDLKGDSRKVAEGLRNKNDEFLRLKHDSMKMAAEKRKQELDAYAEAERKKKQDIADKKASLRKVQDQDAMAKQDFRNRQSHLSGKQDDFKEQNILSYVYEAKKNKSHEYDAKKQANIAKIIEAFPVKSKLDQYGKAIPGNDDAFNPTQGPSSQEAAMRQMTKKKKEMEAKMFQDQQVKEKMAFKDVKKQQQADDYKRMVNDVETFQKEEAQKKIDKMNRNKSHLDQVKKQMTQPSRTFAKTGVAVIKNQGMPQLPV